MRWWFRKLSNGTRVVSHLSFEQFRLKVISERASNYYSFPTPPRPSRVKTWFVRRGTDCPECKHEVATHGIPGDEGCGTCRCPLMWVTAGLRSLGLPDNYFQDRGTPDA